MNILQLDNTINHINSYAVINNNRLIINNFDASLAKINVSDDLINEITSSFKDVLEYDEEPGTINLLGSINLDSFFRPDLSINVIGRNTQGVRLIKLHKDDEIASVAKIDIEDEGEEISNELKESPEGSTEEGPVGDISANGHTEE